MSVIPNKLSITSAIGVNSDTIISGGNWSGNTYTGQWEKNDYAYIGSRLRVTEPGTLYYDFSIDNGVTFSSYPVLGFTITSGINEVHTAWKGGASFRQRFVGTGGRDLFLLETYYSNLSLPLSAPLNQSINGDQDASVVRAISIGENPTGSFVNEKVDGEAFKTVTPLGIGGVYTSSLISTTGFIQIETRIFSNVAGTLVGRWYDDVNKTTLIRTFTRPYSGTELGSISYFSSPMFGDYLEYEYTNGAVAQTSFYFELHETTKSISGQILGLSDFIPSSVVANLGRNVIVGKESDGSYENVSITETSNVSGIQYNLNVVSGARPSQISGRIPVRIVIDGVTTNTLLRTNTSTLNLYITDIILSVDNSSTITSGSVKLRDGTTVAGAVVLPLLVAEAPTSETAVSQITHTFNEPLLFETGVFLQEGPGTNTISGILLGYEE